MTVGRARWPLVVAVLAVGVLAVGVGARRSPRVAGAAAIALPPSAREIPVGAPLPPLTLTDDRGLTVALPSLRGSPALLMFFQGTSCPSCRRQLAAVAPFEARFRAAGVQLVASSPDTPTALADLRRELGLSMRLLSDGDELAVRTLCAGLSHCEVLTDGTGVVRWGAFAESWSRTPAPDAVLAAAASL